MSGAPQVAVGAVVIDAGRLLVVRRARPPAAGYWSLPGGRVEAGELVAAAVVREVLEETGLEVVCGPLVGWVERIGEGHHFVILDFEVTILGDDDPVAGDDASVVAWASLADLAEWRLVEGLWEFLDEHGITGRLD